MRTLNFSARYVESIQQLQKTTTIRKPSRRLPAAGEVVEARARGSKFARLKILRSEAIRLSNLTNADALEDGFADAEALRKTIASLYPGVDELVRLSFVVLPESGEKVL